MSDLKYIPLNLIDGPDHAMRDDLNEDALKDLVESIHQVGIITPLTIRSKGERYEVIAGARRRMAAIMAGLGEVPCVVRVAGDSEATVVKMHENLVREDVDAVAEGRFITEAMAQLSIGVEEFAERIKRSVEYVRARVAVHGMPDYMKGYIRDGRLGLGVALLLAQVDEEPRRKNWVDDAIKNGMTRQTAEYAVNVYRITKEQQASAESGEYVPPLPDIPPTIMWECARCGTPKRGEDLQVVRICRTDCALPDSAS